MNLGGTHGREAWGGQLGRARGAAGAHGVLRQGALGIIHEHPLCALGGRRIGNDGGNVEVVSVDPADMSVQLQLQGACGSCPSSTVTMKMGIERILRENWADVGDVVDIGGAVEAPAATLSIETAHEALSTILPAIAAMGGSVRIVSAAEAHVVLEYTGPEKVKMGIELALKDSPLIDTVEFA